MILPQPGWPHDRNHIIGPRVIDVCFEVLAEGTRKRVERKAFQVIAQGRVAQDADVRLLAEHLLDDRACFDALRGTASRQVFCPGIDPDRQAVIAH